MKVVSLTLHAFIFTSLMCSCGKEIQNSGNGNNFKTSQNHHKAYDPTENLRVAVEKQSRVLVMQALAEKANPNHVTKNGEHILNVAIKVGNIEIVHKLIEAGANINAKNNNNDYALIVAIKNKKKEIRFFNLY